MRGTETFVLEHLGELVFAGLGAVVGFLWHRLGKTIEEQKALKSGVLAMLHDRLYQSCTHYMKEGWIDTAGMSNIRVIYEAYHGLGGNGTGTKLYERACALPIKED